MPFMSTLIDKDKLAQLSEDDLHKVHVMITREILTNETVRNELEPQVAKFVDSLTKKPTAKRPAAKKRK